MTRWLETPGGVAAALNRYDALYAPRCDAPLPFEPGPACARPIKHKGVHRTMGGLFTWEDKEEDDG